MPSATPLPRSLLAGVAIGVFSGLFGVGGGALAVPALLWLGLRQHTAHATSLAALALTATAGVVPFALAEAVAGWPSAVLIGGTLVGTVIGAGAMHRLPERGLAIAFALLLVGVSIRLLVGVEAHVPGGTPAMGPETVLWLAALGVGAGVLSSILGIGGGIVLVPALVLGFGFSQHAAEGTSLAVIIPTALLGAVRHTRRGYTDWRTGLTIGLGGMVGAPAGAGAALAVDALALQRLFAVLLLVLGLRLLWRERSGQEGR